MAGFEVQTELVAALSAQVAETSEQLGAGLAVIEADVQDALACGWRGVAAAGFARGWDEWSAGARDVLGALAAMADVLAATAAGYRRADAASVLVR